MKVRQIDVWIPSWGGYAVKLVNSQDFEATDVCTEVGKLLFGKITNGEHKKFDIIVSPR